MAEIEVKYWINLDNKNTTSSAKKNYDLIERDYR